MVQRKGAKKRTIKTVKFNKTNGQWIESVEGYKHFCTPKNTNEVKGVDVRRSVEAEMAAGVKETAAAARVRINSRVQKQYGSDEGYTEIRAAACGNVVATQLALSRAKRKKFPNVRTYQELLSGDNQLLHYTLRGMEAVAGDDYFQEKLLLYGDDEMLIFASPGQLALLRKCQIIICDGTFKFAPAGTAQIYRIFGLIHGKHATPLVTVLLRGKTMNLYRRMWIQVKNALSQLGNLKWKSANFDAETAAYSSFADLFSGVSVKLCSFHAKQGIFRKVQGTGLQAQYKSNTGVQRIIRIVGALQICPMQKWPFCLVLIRSEIEGGEFHQETKVKLMTVLEYFEKTWLKLGKIFCLFGYKGPRTTNHAESYHGKQRLHFSMHYKLGHWLVAFRQLTQMKEQDAVEVYERRQPAKQGSTQYVEVTTKLFEIKEKLLEFLATKDGEAKEERYKKKLKKYLSRVGRLMGITVGEYKSKLESEFDETTTVAEVVSVATCGGDAASTTQGSTPSHVTQFGIK